MNKYTFPAILLLILSPSVCAQIQFVSLAESTVDWSSAASLTRNAYEGRFAIAYDIPNTKTGFLTFDYLATGIDLTHYTTLAFWWKVEGSGLRNFKIKVRNYPLAGGMEAVYTFHEAGEAPTDWTLAVAKIAEPHFDNWGGEPDLERRYITFRAVTDPSTNVRLFIDRIVALPETFAWEAGAPSFDPAPGPNVDFNGDGAVDFSDFILFAPVFGLKSNDNGYEARFDIDSDAQIGFTDFIAFSQGYGSPIGRWHVPVSFFSKSADPLSIILGSQSSPIYTTELAAGSQQQATIPIPASLMSGRDSTDTHPIQLWSQVSGIRESRASTTTYVPQSGLSQTWLQFREANRAGTEPILPRFSFAGYANGVEAVPVSTGTVFKVEDYGAFPDDGVSDHAGIQATIDAAVANGGGRVVFPAGHFLVNTDADARVQIKIRSSDIILQGAGSREGGTIIQQVNYMPPTQPENLWTSPYMFRFEPTSSSDLTLANITEDATRESFWITVNNSSKISVGDRVKLVMTSTEAVGDFLSPHTAEPSWTRLFEDGIRVREKHTIAEIDGRRLRLGEPLHTNVRSRYGWTVTGFKHIERVGVEDICFLGSWKQPFVHHQDAIHDGGWSLVNMYRVSDSWIRRCSFINVNRAVSISNAAAVSIYHVTQAGNKGHSSIAVGDSYGVWIGVSEDLAGHHHGPGSSARSTGTVYWRYDTQPSQRIDAHGDQPYANLLDCVNGGNLYGSGASIRNLPNHLKHYVLWNYNHRSNLSTYDFWRKGESARDRFVNPIIVGFHGDPVTFNSENLEVLESLGSPVEPSSLFEAQMKLRLGFVPVFYQSLRDEWERLRSVPLPQTLESADP